MQLVFLIVVLGTLAIADVVPAKPVGHAYWRLAGVLGGVAFVTLWAMLAARATVARLTRWPHDSQRWLTRFARYRRAHVWLWVIVAGTTTLGLDWARVVRYDWGLERAIVLDELLLLVPALLPMLLAWAAYYDVERLLDDFDAEPAACHAENTADWGGKTRAASNERLAFVVVRVRHQVALWLLPLLAVVGVQDAMRRWRPEWSGTEYTLGTVAVAVAGVMLLFPEVLRWIWRAYPLPAGTLRTRLEAEASSRGFRFRELLVWPTNDSLAGAAVAGMLPLHRYVFFSDRLIEHLSDEEITAVFAHEMGHVRHRHMLLRLGLLLVPLMVWQMVVAGWPVVMGWVDGPKSLVVQGDLAALFVAVATLAVLVLYMVAVFGFWSRRLEMQADLFACEGAGLGERRIAGEQPASGTAPQNTRTLGNEETGQRRHSLTDRSNDRLASNRTEVFIAALEKLAWLNGTDRRSATWQHGSIARRVELLRRALSDAYEARRLHHQVRLLTAGLLVLFVLGGIGCVLNT